MRWRRLCAACLAPAFLAGSLAVGLGGPIADFYRRMELIVRPPPITVNSQRAHWIGDRLLEVKSTGAAWHRTCGRVSINRLLLLADGTYVATAVKVVAGPLVGTTQDPRYDLSIVPQERAPSTFQVTIPAWVDPQDVRFYVTNGLVPDTSPCSDGWAGPWRIFTASIEPPPDTTEEDP